MMRTHYIEIGDNEWGVLLFYDFDYADRTEMSAIMDSFGVYDAEIRRALNVLFDPNSGMTISRPDLRMSAMFISDATSVEQFIDTVAHEIDHVQSAICDYYGIDYGGEDAAWLQGFLAQKVAEKLRGDGWDCCKSDFM